MPKSGGAYVYIERAFGPIMGTISGIGLWLSLLLKSSFALVGFGAYLLVIINIPVEYIKYISSRVFIINNDTKYIGSKESRQSTSYSSNDKFDIH